LRPYLKEEGWEVVYDEESDRPLFVDEQSGLSQVTAPTLAATAGDWVGTLLLETLTLVQPLAAGAYTRPLLGST
jgi:hypothetical protein